MLIVVPIFFGKQIILLNYFQLIIYLLVATEFSFLINDYYDQNVDKIEEKKKIGNFFANERKERLIGLFILILSWFSSFIMPIMFNKPYLQVFNILILYPIGFFYCHPKIRLRNRIFFDWIIHSIWPACVFAIIYFFYFSTIDLLFGIYFIFGLFFGLFAQIENQIRDFEIDKTNNDNNTTQFIGIIKTNNIRILLMFVITFCLIIIFYLNNKIIPILIIIATLLIIPLTKYRGKDFKLILVCWVIIYVISDIFSL